MSRERQQRVFQILDEALDRPSEERPAFLADACGGDAELIREVEDLLETEAGEGVLAEPAFSVHAEDPWIGRRIDHYQLVRLLDRGGMGTVYLAEREDFEQRVALKLIRRGLDADDVLVRRFHNERAILARLEHPRIARLLDGGTTADRLPYFVMEYIEGEPIDRYCRSHSLSVEERLELFREVCSAVQFAHRNLVVHRDLKPGNILISTDGQPKLLDFGIAKLLDDSLAARTLTTTPGRGPMTPRYASPEQIRLEPITTASDVYALGVLLYELLTGLDPYHLDTTRSDEIARAICEHEPDKPSTAVRRQAAEEEVVDVQVADLRRLRKRLAGDLDSIVLKALRKEPHERYGSVEQLSEDIRRHLSGLPVKAQAGSFVYHVGKFVRRNRLALTVTAAFLVLSLSFGVVSTILWRQAVAERQQADIERKQADIERQRAERDRKATETAFKFLKDLFKEADPIRSRGKNLTAFEVLELGKMKVVEGLEDQPELRIEIAGTLGDIFRNLGFLDDSQELMELALRLVRQHYTGDHSEVAKRLNNLAALFSDRANYAEAERLYGKALEIWERLGQPNDRLKTQSSLATVLMYQGDFSRSEELHLDVLKTRIGIHEANHQNVATSRNSLGGLYFAKGELTKAEAEVSQALNIRQQASGDAGKIASALNLLGNILAAQGRLEEAEEAIDEALEIRRQTYQAGHFIIARAQQDLAALLLAKDLAKSRALLSEALVTLYRTKPESWAVADAESVRGAILTHEKRFEEAESYLVKAYEDLVRLRGKNNYRTKQALARIVDLYEVWNQPEELERYRALQKN